MSRKTLLEELKCPIDWAVHCTEIEFATELRFLWYFTVKEHQVDMEASLFSQNEFVPCENEIDFLLEDCEINLELEKVKSWKLDAKTTYLDFAKRFCGLKAATYFEHSKHLCPSECDDKEIAALSNERGVGVVFPKFGDEIRTRLVWAAMESAFVQKYDGLGLDDYFEPNQRATNFKHFFGGNGIRIFCDVFDHIGCAAGRPSKYACIDIDFSTPLAHMFPVSEEEFVSGKIKATCPIRSI